MGYISVLCRNKVLVLFCTILLCIGVLRIVYCLQLPVNTGDVMRHARYGLLVKELGPSVASYPLTHFNPDFERVCWSEHPYIYPVVTLLFDTLVMLIFPTIFSLKFALTLLEAVSAYLIFRHTGEKWLALIYWASPVSIWWTSHEGQFEALQNLFMIAAIYLLPRRRRISWLCLFLAIQVKITSLLLLPFFILSDKESRPLFKKDNIVLAVISFIPTFIGALFYSPMFPKTGMRYNPYYWNLFSKSFFGWNPAWLIISDQVSTYGAILLLFWLIYQSANRSQYVAPLAFLALCKIWRSVNFWYMVTIPALLLPIEHRRVRLLAFMLVPLLDVSSLIQILTGPFGFQVGDYYAGMSALSIIEPFR